MAIVQRTRNTKRKNETSRLQAKHHKCPIGNIDEASSLTADGLRSSALSPSRAERAECRNFFSLVLRLVFRGTCIALIACHRQFDFTDL